MSRAGASVAVVVVVLDVVAAVVVNLATDGAAAWLWPLLGLVVLVTCALAWWQYRRPASAGSTRVRIRAGTGSAVEDSMVDVPSRGDVNVSTTASWWGRVQRSPVKVRR